MIKGIILIGFLLFLVSLCANPETETDRTASSQKETTSPQKPMSDPPPIPEELKWNARRYEVLETKDISAMGRKRLSVRILAPTARTREERIATAQAVAIAMHRKTWPDFVTVFIEQVAFDLGHSLAQVDYAPDGCGLSGTDCTGEMWTGVRATDQQAAPEQLALWEAWVQHRDQFREQTGMRKGIVNEDRLQAFLAKQFDMPPDEIGNQVAVAMIISTQQQSVVLPQEQRQKGALTAADKERACRQNLQCWGDRTSIAAAVFCQDHIERMAQYAHEWTDGWTEPKFSRFKWKDREAGEITYIGDKMRFQNGLGAWENIIYECDFHPDSSGDSGRVLATRGRPGKIR